MSMVLKCADVAGPTKPKHTHLRMSELVMQEFYEQGDLERENGMHAHGIHLCRKLKSNWLSGGSQRQR